MCAPVLCTHTKKKKLRIIWPSFSLLFQSIFILALSFNCRWFPLAPCAMLYVFCKQPKQRATVIQNGNSIWTNQNKSQNNFLFIACNFPLKWSEKLYEHLFICLFRRILSKFHLVVYRTLFVFVKNTWFCSKSSSLSFFSWKWKFQLDDGNPFMSNIC